MTNKIKSSKSGIFVKDLISGNEYSEHADDYFEGSSTVKTAIVLLVLQKIIEGKGSLGEVLEIKPSNLSIGSGILNWTDIRRLTIEDHIKYLARYSDCVATNVLIDYLGGKESLNEALKNQNFKTRLQMDSLQFTDQEIEMPKVTKTTPRDIAMVFTKMINGAGDKNLARLTKELFSFIDQPWYEDTLDLSRLGTYKIWQKTGSMMEIGLDQDSAMNLVGLIELPNNLIQFSCLNRVSFKEKASNEDIYQVKKGLMSNLVETILKFTL